MLCNTSGSSFALLLLRPSFAPTFHHPDIPKIVTGYLTAAPAIRSVPFPDAVSAVAADLAVFNAHSLSSVMSYGILPIHNHRTHIDTEAAWMLKQYLTVSIDVCRILDIRHLLFLDM
jgi:hypothetical protein